MGNLKTNLHDPRIDCNYEKWGELDKKIKMVEKVMAENGSEVEIMKKYYTKVSHNVTTYRSFCHEPHSVIITKIKEALTSPKVKRFSSTPTSRLPSDSINRVHDCLFRPRINYQMLRLTRSTDIDNRGPALINRLFSDQHTRHHIDNSHLNWHCL